MSSPAALSQKVLHRPPLVLPSIGALPSGSVATAGFAETLLEAIGKLESEDVWNAPVELTAVLQHELSAHLEARMPHKARLSRSEIEAEALAVLPSATDAWRSSSSGFHAILARINGHTAPESDGRRTSNIGLNRDLEGTAVRFPAPEAVHGLIDRAYLVATDEAYPVVIRAAIVYVALLNAHPYTDGNGRTARAAANLILRSAHPSLPYLPLYEFGLRSRGGDIIAIRSAEVFGRWSLIIDYLSHVISISAELNRRELRPAD